MQDGSGQAAEEAKGERWGECRFDPPEQHFVNAMTFAASWPQTEAGHWCGKGVAREEMEKRALWATQSSDTVKRQDVLDQVKMIRQSGYQEKTHCESCVYWRELEEEEGKTG